MHTLGPVDVTLLTHVLFGVSILVYVLSKLHGANTPQSITIGCGSGVAATLILFIILIQF